MYDPQSPVPIDPQDYDPRTYNGNTGVTGRGIPPPPGAPPAAPPAAPEAPPPAPPSSGAFDRDQFRDTLMGSVHNTTDLANFVKAHQGDFGAGVQLAPGGKGDKIVLPDGSVIDAVLGAGVNGGQGSAWTGAGTMGANGQMIPQAAGGGGAQSGGGGFQDQIRAQLLQILQNSQQPVTASDPQIASQMTASKALADRMAQQQRGAAAERAAFQGTLNGGQSSGSFDSDLNGIQENEGQQLQGLQASLFGRVAQQKQAQLQQALSLAVQSGDAESARAIQLQIAQMENQIRQQQLAQQGSQWNDQFGLQAGQFQYQKDRDAALFGGGGF